MKIAILFLAALPGFAQLVSHPDAPVRIGHYHLNVTSVEAHKKFWAGTLGGKAMKFGDIDVIEFPDAFIFLRVQKPSGPTFRSWFCPSPTSEAIRNKTTSSMA